MPRHADVDEQKRNIAQAVWRIAELDGLEGISLRSIAAEAGISMGRVQHYFKSRDEMLLFGLELAQNRLEQRVEARLQALSEDIGQETILRTILDELLGANKDTRQLLRVSVAFYVRAMNDPAVAKVLTNGDELQALAEDVFSARPDLDAREESIIAFNLAVGLGTEVALGRMKHKAARTTLNYHLDRVLGS